MNAIIELDGDIYRGPEWFVWLIGPFESKCSRCFRSANIISKRPVQERNYLKGIWEKETTYILIYLEHFSWQKKGDICTKFREFTENF